MEKKRLKSGYTTGACAAAASKAAALLVTGTESDVGNVEIPFPDGSRVKFSVHSSQLETAGSCSVGRASVIKDAGDDPDITHGAEIVAEARLLSDKTDAPDSVLIRGGRGVGKITKPGLAIPVGEPAINPVPRQMIREAVREAVDIRRGKARLAPAIEITISVIGGEELAKKTLNSRLGIIGGISVLGSTGIVRPVSTKAWTDTITSSMDVAKAVGLNEIVISAGRTSEKAHIKKYAFPEESYALMGDHLEYSVKEAAKHEFKKIHLCAQWAKMVKIAMATPQTHVRFGALDTKKALKFLNSLGAELPADREFNTAREMYDAIRSSSSLSDMERKVFINVCREAKKYCEEIAGRGPVIVNLVSYEGEVIVTSE